MFSIFGRPTSHHGILSRRHFLTAGALGAGDLSLAGLLRGEEAAGIGSSSKSIINIHLDGGPPQIDTIDLKPGNRQRSEMNSNQFNHGLPGWRSVNI